MRGKLSFMSGPRYKPLGYFVLSVQCYTSGGTTDAAARVSHITIKNRSPEWNYDCSDICLLFLWIRVLIISYSVFHAKNSTMRNIKKRIVFCVVLLLHLMKYKCNTVCVHIQSVVTPTQTNVILTLIWQSLIGLLQWLIFKHQLRTRQVRALWIRADLRTRCNKIP